MKLIKAKQSDVYRMMDVSRNSGYPLPQYTMTLERFNSYFKKPTSIFVAFEKDELIGYVAMKYYFRDGCEIDSIEVKKKFHKKGIGTALLKKAEKETKKLGKSKIYLIVYNKNFNAVSFYTKHKFYVLDKVEGHYSGGESALMMVKDL